MVDYNDYVYDTVFDGTNDHVFIRFPESLCNISLWTYYPTTQFIDSVAGNTATWELQEAYRYYSNAYPMGYGYDAADSPKLDLSNIPDGTSIHFDITYNWLYYDGETGLINTPMYDAWAIYYNAAGDVVSSQQFTAGTTPGEGPNPSDTWSFDLTINKPSDAISLFVYAQLDSMVVYEEGEITFTLSNFTMDFSVAALYRLQQQTGKNSAVLSSIETQLRQQGQTIQEFVSQQEITNDLLGDINSGGAAGEDLSDKADTVTGDLGQIDDFTSDLESDLEEGFTALLDFGGLVSLAAAFDFIGDYLNKLWYGMSDVQIIYVLTFGLGAFLMLTQHVPRIGALRSRDPKPESYSWGKDIHRIRGESHSYTVVQDSFFE